jgi:hypothetical protein
VNLAPGSSIIGQVMDSKTKKMKSFSAVVQADQPHDWGVRVMTTDAERVTVSKAALSIMKINGKVPNA